MDFANFAPSGLEPLISYSQDERFSHSAIIFTIENPQPLNFETFYRSRCKLKGAIKKSTNLLDILTKHFSIL